MQSGCVRRGIVLEIKSIDAVVKHILQLPRAQHIWAQFQSLKKETFAWTGTMKDCEDRRKNEESV